MPIKVLVGFYGLLRLVDCIKRGEQNSRAKALKKVGTPMQTSAYLTTDFAIEVLPLLKRIEFPKKSNSHKTLEKELVNYIGILSRLLMISGVFLSGAYVLR